MGNLLFVADAAWHIWALASGHTEYTLISKFLLCFILAILLKQQLGNRLPVTVLVAVLFCLVGDVLLQALDLNYADLSGERQVHFILGVLCFCVAYGQLALYFLRLNPDCLTQIRTHPGILLFNVFITLAVLIWMTLHNQAPAYLLIVLWLYSPVVVAAATLAAYTQTALRLPLYLMLIAGTNVIVFSDTVIGLTVFAKMTMPVLSNPVWILSTYMVGIGLVFNAVIQIEQKRSARVE